MINSIIAEGAFKLEPSKEFLRTLNREEYYKIMSWCRSVKREMVKAECQK